MHCPQTFFPRLFVAFRPDLLARRIFLGKIAYIPPPKSQHRRHGINATKCQFRSSKICATRSKIDAQLTGEGSDVATLTSRLPDGFCVEWGRHSGRRCGLRKESGCNPKRLKSSDGEGVGWMYAYASLVEFGPYNPSGPRMMSLNARQPRARHDCLLR